jgi:hypothetical protein
MRIIDGNMIVSKRGHYLSEVFFLKAPVHPMTDFCGQVATETMEFAP